MSSSLPENIDFSVIPRWVTEKYSERQADMEKWLISWYFWSRWEGKVEEIEEEKLKARALAEAKIAALDNSLELEHVSGEVALSLLVDASTENWYRYAEVEDLLEFLHDKLDEYMEHIEAKKAMGQNIKVGGVYEVRNLITVIQGLIDLGVPKDQIIPIRHNLSKARIATYSITKILESTLPEKKKQAEVLSILKAISDPKVSVQEFKQARLKQELEARSGTLPIMGELSILRTGEMLFIRSPDTAMTKAIQHSLKGLVNGWSNVDAVNLATRITDEISTKDKYKPTRLVEGRIIQGGEGIMMPTPERFQDLAMMEIGHSEYLLRQVLGYQPASLVVFRFGIRLGTSDAMVKYIREQFQTRSSFNKLNDAIQEFYIVPEGLHKLFEISSCGLYWSPGESLSVSMQITS